MIWTTRRISDASTFQYDRPAEATGKERWHAGRNSFWNNQAARCGDWLVFGLAGRGIAIVGGDPAVDAFKKTFGKA